MGMFDMDCDSGVLKPVLLVLKGTLLDLLPIGFIKEIVNELKPGIGDGLGY
jgi:hypothetical protein